MDNLNQTFDTLKRVNASLHKLNDALMRDYSITVAENLELRENLKAANANFDKLALECAKLRERNIELEQMLGAISLQCERELSNKDARIKLLEENYNDNREYVVTLDRQYRNFLDQRDIELKLLVGIIKGEI